MPSWCSMWRAWRAWAMWKMQGGPNACIEVLTSGIAECDFVWERAFTEIIKLKRGNWDDL